MPSKLKLYIAGPDVFEPDPINVGTRLKDLAHWYGFTPLYPMDNAVSTIDPNPSLTIFQGNANMIRQADIVVANLNPFRGTEPDSGTVWEVGYALGLGKRVIGHIKSDQTMLARVLASQGSSADTPGPYLDTNGCSIENFGHPLNLMLMHSIEHLVIGDFEIALQYLSQTMKQTSQ
jgi:nucleoside 2-deoxyribosyltransferase